MYVPTNNAEVEEKLCGILIVDASIKYTINIINLILKNGHDHQEQSQWGKKRNRVNEVFP